jgi:hypothetical protein
MYSCKEKGGHEALVEPVSPNSCYGKPTRNYAHPFAFAGRWGSGACFQSGNRSVPRRRTARGSLFSNREIKAPEPCSPRPEPYASHVGVMTQSRRDGPAASVPQPIGYHSPFRQTNPRQAVASNRERYPASASLSEEKGANQRTDRKLGKRISRVTTLVPTVWLFG